MKGMCLNAIQWEEWFMLNSLQHFFFKIMQYKHFEIKLNCSIHYYSVCRKRRTLRWRAHIYLKYPFNKTLHLFFLFEILKRTSMFCRANVNCLLGEEQVTSVPCIRYICAGYQPDQGCCCLRQDTTYITFKEGWSFANGCDQFTL